MNAVVTPSHLLLKWLLTPRIVVALCCGGGVLASALAVSYYAHRMRAVYAQEQALAKAHDALLVERGRLLLERGALSALARVEQVAVGELGMRLPTAADMRLVQPNGATQLAAVVPPAAVSVP